MGYEGMFMTDCAVLNYESPDLVVLSGKKFLVDTIDTVRFSENTLIWQAVEAFITIHGYSVDSVIISNAQRNDPNPHEFIIVMSK
jgi:hypothetical protein